MVLSSTRTMISLFAGLLFNLPMVARAGGLRGSLGGITQADVESRLISELIGVVADERPEQLEAAMRVTYGSLPKNAYGNLDHQAVRYVLHRMFVQHHGWFIKGLEPDGDTFGSIFSLEWVPSYIQSLLEKRLGTHGMNLRELATVAATLESLIHKEAGDKLKLAYNAHGFSVSEPLADPQLQNVIGTYMVDFLEPGDAENSTTLGKTEEARARFEEFTATYTGWPEVAHWLRGVELTHMSSDPDGGFNFAAAQSIIEDIGQKYSNFNDVECRSLKSTLMEMEENQAGRVRLSVFYKKSLYSHWQFTEKKEYLRQLGVLDESDTNNVQVILPNYVGARPNCLEASNIYAICCRNECEDLMGSIEREIGAPVAKAAQIAKLVEALPSDTVQAPRELSERLVGRLNQVAANNGGTINLHGRLFAQWMHHVYPRECPFPHEAGTTNPMTPDEWMQATGHESVRASDAELLEHAETSGAQPQVVAVQEGEEVELHWSHAEELLATPQQLSSSTDGSLRSYSRALAVLLVLAAAAMLSHSSYERRRRGAIIGCEDDGPEKPSKNDEVNIGVLIAFCIVSIVVLVFDLFDVTVFIGAMLVGCVLIGLQRFLPQGPSLAKKCV